MSYIKEALDKFIQGYRVIEGYEPVTELWNLLCPLFGDTRVVQRTGLIKQFENLKQIVEEKNNISLIIYGANLYDDADRIIDDYPTQSNTIITLTIKSVCQAFLNDHMTEDEIKELINKN